MVVSLSSERFELHFLSPLHLLILVHPLQPPCSSRTRTLPPPLDCSDSSFFFFFTQLWLVLFGGFPGRVMVCPVTYAERVCPLDSGHSREWPCPCEQVPACVTPSGVVTPLFPRAGLGPSCPLLPGRSRATMKAAALCPPFSLPFSLLLIEKPSQPPPFNRWSYSPCCSSLGLAAVTLGVLSPPC